jgi:hypothetical protein
VLSFRFEQDDDKDEDAMDIFTLAVEGIGKFQFECDDGNVMQQSFTDFAADKRADEAIAAVVEDMQQPQAHVVDKSVGGSSVTMQQMVDEVAVSTQVPRSLLDPSLVQAYEAKREQARGADLGSCSSTDSESEDETTVVMDTGCRICSLGGRRRRQKYRKRMRRSKSRLAKAGKPSFQRSLTQEDDPAVAMQHIQEYMQKDFENVMISWIHANPLGSFEHFLLDKFPENIEIKPRARGVDATEVTEVAEVTEVVEVAAQEKNYGADTQACVSRVRDDGRAANSQEGNEDDGTADGALVVGGGGGRCAGSCGGSIGRRCAGGGIEEGGWRGNGEGEGARSPGGAVG